MIMNIAGIVISFFIIIIFEAPEMVRKKLWGELATFSVLILVGLAQAVYLTLR